MQLNPNQPFPIVRQLDAATDPTTYYVQSVIRYASNNKLLTTVNLVDQGSQYFTGMFTPPADPGNNGYWLSVTTSVYTDSNYTQLSPVYSTTNAMYLVQLRFNTQIGYGGDSGMTPGMLRDLIREELEFLRGEKPSFVSIEEIEEALIRNLSPIGGRLANGFDSITGEYGKAGEMMLELVSRKDQDRGAILGRFEELLNSFVRDVAAENAAHRTEVEGVARELSNKIISSLAHNVAHIKEHGSKWLEVTQKEIAKHVSSMFETHNEQRKHDVETAVDGVKEMISQSLTMYRGGSKKEKSPEIDHEERAMRLASGLSR